MAGQVELKKDTPGELVGKVLASFLIHSNAPSSDSIYDVSWVYSSREEVDGYWLIWEGDRIATWACGDSSDSGQFKAKRVIGIVNKREEVEQKTYERARDYAMKKAQENRTLFVDKTSRAKESPLVGV